MRRECQPSNALAFGERVKGQEREDTALISWPEILFSTSSIAGHRELKKPKRK